MVRESLDPFRVVTEEKGQFTVFVVLNFCCGGMALWLGPLLSLTEKGIDSSTQFFDALRQGNGYLFGIAVMGASVAYFFREFQEAKDSDFKELKLVAMALSMLLVFCIAIFLSQLLTHSMINTSKSITGMEILIQSILTVIALIFSTYLYCLAKLDDYPTYGERLKRKTQTENKKQMAKPEALGYQTGDDE